MKHKKPKEKTMEENLKTYQCFVRANIAIEENRPGSEIIILACKVALFFPLKLRKIKKESRNEFITYILRALEYEARKKCGYELTYEQEVFCFRVNWMTSILVGIPVINVEMTREGEYDGTTVEESK